MAPKPKPASDAAAKGPDKTESAIPDRRRGAGPSKAFPQERVGESGAYYASPVAANGHIYFTSLDGGAVTVFKAGSDKPELVAKNPKLGDRTAATPAIADAVLFIRTDQHIYAFAKRK